MKEYQFEYGGKVYECVGDDKDFQIWQFNHIIKIQDWVTVRNRIRNQTTAFDCLIEVDKSKITKIKSFW